MVTGGARSGKSSFAQSKTEEIGSEIAYIATAKVTDSDMADRIEKHKDSRPSEWYTIEQYKDFMSLKELDIFKVKDTFLLDCITIMVNNLMFEEDIDYDTCSMEEVAQVEQKIMEELKYLIQIMTEEKKQLIMVTNEVGLGLVPAYRLGNLFRDIAGRVNQYLAQVSDEVYLVVSGLPLKIK
jgi:adenosylcobinamide kinase/adenosylcobinamide-phosphate guanylyltransferase